MAGPVSRDFGREESLWWVDELIGSVAAKRVRIGTRTVPIPLRFRQPLLLLLRQLREAVAAGEQRELPLSEQTFAQEEGKGASDDSMA